MNLPKTIADLLAAPRTNTTAKSLQKIFRIMRVVHDEGKTYHGKKKLSNGMETTNAKYKTKYEPLDISTKDEEIVVLTAKISRGF